MYCISTEIDEDYFINARREIVKFMHCTYKELYIGIEYKLDILETWTVSYIDIYSMSISYEYIIFMSFMYNAYIFPYM